MGFKNHVIRQTVIPRSFLTDQVITWYFLPEYVAESRYVCHRYYHTNMILHIIFDNFIKSKTGWTFFLFLEYLFLKTNVEILEFLRDNPVRRYFTSIGFTSTSHDGFHSLTNERTTWKSLESNDFHQIKGSSDQSYFIFEINVGKGRIRHRTTLKLNF